MSERLPPMPSPSPIQIEAYVPRLAFDRITPGDMQAAAKRLGYDGSLRWQAFPGPDGSVHLVCRVIEGSVFLESFRALVDVASANQEDDLLMSCADALTALYDAMEKVLKDYER